MIQIKIYDKSFSILTAFNAGEFFDLSYNKINAQIGSASFSLDNSNAKVTSANLRNYNRMQILSDGVVAWTGYIISKHITLNTVQISCKEIIGILGKRSLPDNFTQSGNAATAVVNILAQINGVENTGITMGVTDIVDTINMTFSMQDALSAIQSIASSVGGQFILNADRTLDFKYSLGIDKSASVIFEYNIIQPQQANILKFDVTDNGENIITRVNGYNSGVLTSQQDSSSLQTLFGIIDKYISVPQANNQPSLDKLSASKLIGSLYSPSITLIPDEPDNFDVLDTIKVKIQNKLVSINATFQVLQKDVKIVGSQKTISVKVNTLPQDIVNSIRDLQKQVQLLESN